MIKMDKHYLSLLEKLVLLNDFKRIELSPEEALLYGVEYSNHEYEIMEGEENEH